tara:strand:- start:4 stop:279 length:276 start_codon:yes stop_codon:yes gene_type:complete
MESNRLIAEFMGLIESSIPNKYWTEQAKEGFGKGELVELKYHTSWDWLMPVVQNIEQDCEGVPQEMLNISLYSDINEVYKAVVEFIKNQNN